MPPTCSKDKRCGLLDNHKGLHARGGITYQGEGVIYPLVPGGRVHQWVNDDE